MAPAGFEPTISAGERPQTHDLDSAATGTGESLQILQVNTELCRQKWFAYKRLFYDLFYLEIYVHIDYAFCPFCFAYSDNMFRDSLH
jgi:hypothetical protein